MTTANDRADLSEVLRLLDVAIARVEGLAYHLTSAEPVGSEERNRALARSPATCSSAGRCWTRPACLVLDQYQKLRGYTEYLDVG